MGWIRRPISEQAPEGLLNEASTVFPRLPNLVDAKDTRVVEAGAVVDRTRVLSELEEASTERVVIDGVPVVAEVELGDVCIRHGRFS
jgi:hypothetical protein